LSSIVNIEQNLVYVFREFARSLPGAEVQDNGELFWTLTPIRIALFNSLLAARFDPSRAEAAIEAVKARAQAKGVPLLWWVLPDDRPADLGLYLLAAGFRHVDASPCMALDLASDSLDPAGRIEGTPGIATISSEPDARVWSEVLGIGSALPQAFCDAYLPFVVDVAKNPQGPLRNYGLWLDGEMVATSSLAFDDGVAGIYNVATLPHARRKGLATALTAHAVREGRGLGALVATLQSSKAGFGVYKGLGFQQVGELNQYTWPA
jgi:GNAT superfamily N-acetyltransferase